MKAPLAVCLLAAGAPLAAATILDNEDMSLSLTALVQLRAEHAVARTSAGQRYDIWDGTVQIVDGRDPQQLNFMLPRLRLNALGRWRERTGAQVTLAVDRFGAASDDDGEIALHQAVLTQGFIDSSGEHELRLGYEDSAFQAADIIPASRLLLPVRGYGAQHFAGPRALGIGYRLSLPGWSIAADLRETAQSTDSFASGGLPSSGADNNDFFTSVRVVSSIRPEWWLARRADSYLGKDGFGMQLGAELGLWTIDGADNEAGGIWQLGVDALLHLDRVTTGLGLGLRRAEQSGARDDRRSYYLSWQLAYAFPLRSGQVVEPAFRLGIADLNQDLDDEETLYFAEAGGSGWQIELGINWYITGHQRKLQLGLTTYESEGKAVEADVFRLQYQQLF